MTTPPSTSRAGSFCIFAAVFTAVFVCMLPLTFFGMDSTDTCYHIYSGVAVLQGDIPTRFWWGSNLAAGLWQAMNPTSQVIWWAYLGGALLWSTAAGFTAMLMREMFNAKGWNITVSVLLAYLSIYHRNSDLIIHYFTFPMLLTVIYFYLFLRAIRSKSKAWWLALGAINGLLALARITLVIYCILPVLFYVFEMLMNRTWRFTRWKELAFGVTSFGIIAGAGFGYLYFKGAFHEGVLPTTGPHSDTLHVLFRNFRPLGSAVIPWLTILVPFILLGLLATKNTYINCMFVFVALLLFTKRLVFDSLVAPIQAADVGLALYRTAVGNTQGSIAVGMVFFVLTLVLFLAPFKSVFTWRHHTLWNCEIPAFPDIKFSPLTRTAFYGVIWPMFFAVYTFQTGSNTGTWKIRYLLPLILSLGFVLGLTYWRTHRRHFWIPLGIALLVFLGSMSTVTTSCRDDCKFRLTARSERPELSWTFTSPESIRDFDAFTGAVDDLVEPGDTLFTEHNNYLLQLVLQTKAACMYWGSVEYISNAFHDGATRPQWVIMTDYLYYAKSTSHRSIRDALATDILPQYYRLIVDMPGYRLYERHDDSTEGPIPGHGG